MSERGLNRLFLRYRHKGDTRALGAIFDRVAPELLKLSMHLVRDPLEAEDVLQETFLAAIQAADSFDASRPLVPWLTGILARQAGLSRRKARRVVEPDRLTQREAEDPTEAAALREFSTELVLALQALPDNYREVLWMHLADGKRPVEIAQNLKRAPGTVRMQVHRGLELLRRALPAGYAAGVGVFGATRGLAAIRGDVLSSARASWRPAPPASAMPSASGSLASAIGGSSAITKGVLALLALSAIAATLWWRASPREQGLGELARAEVSTSAPSAAPHSSETAGAIDVLGARAREDKDAAAGAPASTEPILLRGFVRGCRADEFNEVQLRVRGVARFALPGDLDVRGTPAADGSFELDVTRLFAAARAKRPLEELVVESDHPRYVLESLHIPTTIAAGSNAGGAEHRYTAEIKLSLAGLVAGRALAPQSASASGTRVALYAIVASLPIEPPVDFGTCTADGAFCLRARAAGEHALLIMSDGLRPTTIAASLAPGLRTSLGTIVLDEGAVIEGHADHLGLSMQAGALVSVTATSMSASLAFEGARLAWSDGKFERAGRIVETDQDGRFRIGGLAPGPYRLGVSSAAPQGAPASQRRLPLSTAAWTLVDAPASTLEIHATFATVQLRLHSADGSAPTTLKPARVRWKQQGNSTDFPLAFDDLGLVSVEPGLACEVHIEAEGFLAEDISFAAPGPGEEDTQVAFLRRDPKLARLAIQIRVPTDAGATLIGDTSFAFSPQNPAASRAATFVRHATSADGVFQLADLPMGVWSVSVHAGGVYEHYRDRWCEAKLSVTLSPASPASAVIDLERGGQLQICAVNSSGALVAAECQVRELGGTALNVEFVARGPQGATLSRQALSTLGSCDVHPILPAGKYEILMTAKGHSATRMLVDLEPGACARIRAVLQETEQQR